MFREVFMFENIFVRVTKNIYGGFYVLKYFREGHEKYLGRFLCSKNIFVRVMKNI
jgi:hypothetical protein